MDADTARALERMREEMRAGFARIEDAIRNPRPRGRCSAENVERLRRLLPALAGTFGSQAVTVSEMMNDRAIAAIVAPLTAKQLGRLLLRSTTVEGLAVERAGYEHGSTRWSVMQTGLLNPSSPHNGSA